MFRSIGAACLCGILIVGVATQAADDDMVKKKLDDARAIYDKATKDYKEEAQKWFEKEDEAARKLKTGVTEKVKLVAAEKKEFEDKGALPKRAPLILKDKPAKAADTLVKAFKAASDEYSRIKKDAEAAAVEKALAEFRKSVPSQAELDTRKEWVGERATYKWIDGVVWNEYIKQRLAFTWKETARTPEYVEVYDDLRKMWGRFYPDRLMAGKDRKFLTKNMGGSWSK